MQTKTVAIPLTALAALAAAICGYSTMPEDRVLTQAERMMKRGTGTTTCATCITDAAGAKSCDSDHSTLPYPVPTSNTAYYVCFGVNGGKGQGASESSEETTTDAITTDMPCGASFYRSAEITEGIWDWVPGSIIPNAPGCGTVTICGTQGDPNCGNPE
jgi:hypothetical protein